jgi:hypothetical protein
MAYRQAGKRDGLPSRVNIFRLNFSSTVNNYRFVDLTLYSSGVIAVKSVEEKELGAISGSQDFKAGFDRRFSIEKDTL